MSKLIQKICDIVEDKYDLHVLTDAQKKEIGQLVLPTKEDLSALKCVIQMAKHCHETIPDTNYSNIDNVVKEYQKRQIGKIVEMYNAMAEELELDERL
jgi:hypothetical protein